MYPKKGRVILHIDCNAYFASVEVANDSSLKGKPLVVAGNSRTGMVVTASYEARAKGIYTTMTLQEARRKCPDLIVRTPNFQMYRMTSSKLFELISVRYSSVLEVASIDECYVDITNCKELGNPIKIAEDIQKDILETLNIPVSIGIAPNKFLAKMANNLSKGMLQITILRKRDLENVLWGKPVEFAHGIGEKTADKLKTIGIQTIGDLAKAQERMLRDSFGIHLVRLHEYVNGNDNRPVDVESTFQIQTVGNSKTLPYNTSEERIIIEVLEKLAASVSDRMRKNRVLSQHLQITIRYGDFKTVTKSMKLDKLVDDKHDIFHCATSLFKKHWNGDAVRLVGITAMHVIEKKEATEQLDLFNYESKVEKIEPIIKVVDEIKDKFGDKAIKKGIDLLSPKNKRDL